MDTKTVLETLSDIRQDIAISENNWKSVVAGRKITEKQLILLEEQLDATIEKLVGLSRNIKKNHIKLL